MREGRRRSADPRARTPVETARPRVVRRERRGRGIVDGWQIAVGLIVLVALGAAIGFVTRVGHGAAGTGTAAKGRAPSVAAADPAAVVAPEPSAVFARMKHFGVDIHFPASADQMVAVGFHQAWNTKATDFVPVLPVHPDEPYGSTKAALKADASLKLFRMMSRGRGSSEYSAADCAVTPGAAILAPVTGKVTLVTTYKLAGVGTDYRVEIAADGAPGVRVVLIHIQDLVVKEGERVEGGVTPIATVRHLPIDNQVNRYLPVPADHTHIQINAVGYKIDESS